MQVFLLGLVTLLMLAAMAWIVFRVTRQWNSPKKQFQQKMGDIQRRKRELGIVDDDSKGS
jgi:hypothetical protein